MPWITLVQEPPPSLAHYSGPVIERVLPLAEARNACAHMGVRSDACSWKKGEVCHIVIPTGGPVRDLGAYAARKWRIATAGSIATRRLWCAINAAVRTRSPSALAAARSAISRARTTGWRPKRSRPAFYDGSATISVQ